MSEPVNPFGLDDSAEPAEWALEYLRHGIKVGPLFPIRGGRCACGDSWCTCPGEHPIDELGIDFHDDDDTMRSAIEYWWDPEGDWADANVGIALRASRLAVVQWDPKAPQAPAALEEFLRAVPQASETLLAYQTDGRRCYLFRLREEAQVPVRVVLNDAIEVYTEGRVTVPPSIVPDGAPRWAASAKGILFAPDALLRQLGHVDGSQKTAAELTGTADSLSDMEELRARVVEMMRGARSPNERTQVAETIVRHLVDHDRLLLDYDEGLGRQTPYIRMQDDAIKAASEEDRASLAQVLYDLGINASESGARGIVQVLVNEARRQGKKVSLKRWQFASRDDVLYVSCGARGLVRVRDGFL